MLDISCTQTVNVIFTGVIDLPGAKGGIVEFKASLLASYGFATLALAYLGYKDQPSSPSSINLDYFEEAANWLISHSKVLPHGSTLYAMVMDCTVDGKLSDRTNKGHCSYFISVENINCPVMLVSGTDDLNVPTDFTKISKEWCGYPYLAWGGETVAHARTQEDCWPKILHFLRKHL
ncbi:hypothetical protein pdam_00019242 [Pocillopora damicornis]|uniref:BAAT/Acyl-CoA thioester hydrolase C-terminal domain-containing protein n=1 Tax=Pocillopora damicornis TaxID=46731 RepID=A0A3M6TCQ9_POCDA|nr:hypothetical protein pdam_00019242 [Pocillopora damicornis]